MTQVTSFARPHEAVVVNGQANCGRGADIIRSESR